ncbi:hypothetical protein G6F59_014786 [Rhizopus arrhizus]|nr:hypothetical protein G6F59_014786 [Rhizopus arrhizus]
MDLGFGDAWHVIDGLYSGFNENSEFRGSIGVGGRYTFDTAGQGTHSVAAVLFKHDDTGLNHRLSLDDGFLRPDQPPAFSDQMKSVILSYDFRRKRQHGVCAAALRRAPGQFMEPRLVQRGDVFQRLPGRAGVQRQWRDVALVLARPLAADRDRRRAQTIGQRTEAGAVRTQG